MVFEVHVDPEHLQRGEGGVIMRGQECYGGARVLYIGHELLHKDELVEAGVVVS